MTFRGRTVVGLMLFALVAGGLLTLTIVETLSSALPIEEQPSDVAGSLPDGTENGQAGPDGGGTSANRTLTERQMTKIASAFALIQQSFYEDIDSATLVDGAIEGMLAALGDPYSMYMDAEQAERFEESVISSSFSGIGAEVTMNEGRVTVVSPIKGSPAEKAGIRAKDVILSVNGESLEGLDLNEAVMKIRGPKGTKARLEILRGDSSEPIEIVVIRDDIDIETVYAEMLEDGIGKIEIRQFAQKTEDRFREELEKLEARGLTGLIIDVRNNPGGLLPEVVKLVQPFIPEGKTIVQVENRSGQNQKTTSEGTGKPYDIVVLTNGGSASASEIMAAAIQENGVGVVIGETTYGKGTVQSTFDTGVNDGSSIKLTIAKWLTPRGRFIEGKGVEPDIRVELPEFYRVAPLNREEVLQYDETGNEVKKLQIMLNGLGFETGRSDGYFSRQTETALKAFQRANGLPETGKTDQQTIEAIEQKLIEELMKPENDLQMKRALQYLSRRGEDGHS